MTIPVDLKRYRVDTTHRNVIRVLTLSITNKISHPVRGRLMPNFEVSAPGYLPETVALPIRILTTVSMGTSGMSLVWDLVLKPLKAPDDVRGALLNQALGAMREAKPDEARAALRLIPDTADADFLAGGGRIAMLAGDRALAKTLFTSALGVDPSSYRAALGVASVFVLERDFDSASRAFDAARSRTHDKDEQKFLSAAIGDLATIKVR